MGAFASKVRVGDLWCVIAKLRPPNAEAALRQENNELRARDEERELLVEEQNAMIADLKAQLRQAPARPPHSTGLVFAAPRDRVVVLVACLIPRSHCSCARGFLPDVIARSGRRENNIVLFLVCSFLTDIF